MDVRNVRVSDDARAKLATRMERPLSDVLWSGYAKAANEAPFRMGLTVAEHQEFIYELGTVACDVFNTEGGHAIEWLPCLDAGHATMIEMHGCCDACGEWAATR